LKLLSGTRKEERAERWTIRGIIIGCIFRINVLFGIGPTVLKMHSTFSILDVLDVL
jgi:hypothetical protein